jgi:hypothetical protein
MSDCKFPSCGCASPADCDGADAPAGCLRDSPLLQGRGRLCPRCGAGPCASTASGDTAGALPFAWLLGLAADESLADHEIWRRKPTPSDVEIAAVACGLRECDFVITPLYTTPAAPATDAMGALRELVALRDMGMARAKAEHRAATSLADEDYAAADVIQTDIARRTPAAWDAARAVLAAHDKGAA